MSGELGSPKSLVRRACRACAAAYLVCFAACMLSLIAFSVPLYFFFFPVLLYLGLYMYLAVFVPQVVLEKALSFNEKCKAKLKEYNEREKAGRLGLHEGAKVAVDFFRNKSEFIPGKISRDRGDNTYDIDCTTPVSTPFRFASNDLSTHRCQRCYLSPSRAKDAGQGGVHQDHQGAGVGPRVHENSIYKN